MTSTFRKKSNKIENTIKGPKGITFSLLIKYKRTETGSAITLETKITKTPKIGSKTSPAININLMSAHPRLSLLNKKSPKIITPYIIANRKKPLPKAFKKESK